jgi:hypothetical protein
LNKTRLTFRRGSKKAIPAPILPAVAIPVIGDGPVKVLALECWRIRKLIPEFETVRKHLILASSVEKMIAALETAGIAIDDPEGMEFRESMMLNIAAFDPCDTLERGRRVVTQTLSPSIYIHDRLASAARVIVAVGKKEEA